MSNTQNIKRILVVDDSANLRIVIQRYLQAGKYEYTLEFYQAQNGIEAETILQEQSAIDESIDVVFLDWMMPEMTGFDFMKKIRTVEKFKVSPKIIMLTAETYSNQIQACLDYNVSKYIIKPFTQEMLIQSLNEVLANEAIGEVKYAV